MQNKKKRFRLGDVIDFTKKVMDDDVFGLSAQIAYYFLLSIFPMMIFLVTMLSFLPLSETHLFLFIEKWLPESGAGDIIRSIYNDVMERSSVGILSLGLVTAIWSASNGINAVLKTFNISYRVEKQRSFIKQRLLSISFTIGIIITFLFTLLVSVFGNQILRLFYITELILEISPFVWIVLRWGISLLILFITFSLLLCIGPNVKIKFSNAIPGAIFTSVGWLISSLVFSYYVDNLSDFSAIYGSIGGTIVLMLWFFMTAIFILLGGEINAFLLQKRDELQ